MTNNNIVVPFNQDESTTLSSSVSEWAALEQVAIPNSAADASVKDVFAMIGYAKAGMTSLDYIDDNCASVYVKGEKLFVKLDFYVWVSDINLEYTLGVDNSAATIGRATMHSAPTSFDVIFNNTDAVNLSRLFTGSLRAEMPFFNSDGSEVTPTPSISTVGSNVVLSEKATTVLRANGSVLGYKHTMTIEIDVPRVENATSTTRSQYSITGLEATITVQWGNCSASDAQCIANHRDTLKMDIPQCVDDLISSCISDMDGDGDIDIDDLLLSGLPSTLTETVTQGESTGKQIVYYSTCSGKILKQFWKADDE